MPDSQNIGNPVPPYRSRMGDRVFRVPRMITQRIIIPEMRPEKRLRGVSLLSFVYGFAIMIAAGTVLLTLPFFSNSHQFTSLVDCLFTATSAVCVTGLVVVDTLDQWNFFGQLVIMILIQFGGLGFMISTTMFLIAAGRKIGLRERILVRESVGLSGIGGVVRLARNIVVFTLAAEIIGALVFFIRFSSQFEWPLSGWKSLFQSVSSFNNAGFDLFGGFRSLSGYSTDYLVLLTTAGLIILGGISFVVLNNVFHARGFKRSSVDTKLVLVITLILLSVGTVFIFIMEYTNPQTMEGMPLQFKILNAFFQSVTSRTAGFNVLNIGAFTIYTLFFIMLLMFIGGAAGSTAGGIKVNTVGLIVATLWATIRGREHPGAFGREFQLQQILRAMALLVLSFLLILVVFLVLSFTENFPSLNLLFETVSAFGTVGLTTGITPSLSEIGKIMLVLLMFVGRLGPLTLTISLAASARSTSYHFPKESVRIG
jgi:trk system potassium uptake protein